MTLPYRIHLVFLVLATLAHAGCSGRTEAALEDMHVVETPRFEVPVTLPAGELTISSLWFAAHTSIQLDIPICLLVPDYTFDVKIHMRSVQIDDHPPAEIGVCVVQTFACRKARDHFVLIDQRVGSCL